MAKEVPAKGVPSTAKPKPKKSPAERVALVRLTPKLTLNTKKKHGDGTPRDVRSLISLVAPTTVKFNATLKRNKVRQKVGTPKKWELKACHVSSDLQTLTVMAKAVGNRSAATTKRSLDDDTLNLDITVSNSTPATSWQGEATLSHVAIDIEPIGDFTEDP